MWQQRGNGASVACQLGISLPGHAFLGLRQKGWAVAEGKASLTERDHVQTSPGIAMEPDLNPREPLAAAEFELPALETLIDDTSMYNQEPMTLFWTATLPSHSGGRQAAPAAREVAPNPDRTKALTEAEKLDRLRELSRAKSARFRQRRKVRLIPGGAALLHLHTVGCPPAGAKRKAGSNL